MLNQDLVYRVGVNPKGAIIGYKGVNEAARDHVDQTSLANLLQKPVADSAATKEPVAQFKVVFTKNGVPQVSPWWGYRTTPKVPNRK